MQGNVDDGPHPPGRQQLRYIRPVKIFISWSGQRERAVAEALREALPDLCVTEVEVFVSSKSITKGANGTSVIEANLDASDYGIVLVSRENQDAPWLNYEGGWLASTLSRPVSTICLDLRPGDVTSPLAPRQATQFESEEDMTELLQQIAETANPSIPQRALNTLLKSVWPGIRDSWKPDNFLSAGEQNQRSEQDMLAEIVERVRNVESELKSNRTSPLSAVQQQRATAERIEFEAAKLRALVSEVAQGNVYLVEHELGATPPRVTLVSKPEASAADRDRAVTAVKEAQPTARVTVSHIRPLTEPDEHGLRKFIVDQVEQHE